MLVHQVKQMITRDGVKSKGCAIKLSQFLRYYQAAHDSRLSPEQAEEEARREGFIIDYDGEYYDPTKVGVDMERSTK